MSSKLFGNWPLAAALAAGLMATGSAQAANPDPRDDNSPWGMGSSAEWSGDSPKFNPLISQAGTRWIRLWPEWPGVEPKENEFDWKSADAKLEDAKKNNLHTTGFFGYMAPWASTKGDARTLPVKDMQMWRDYVRESVSRYKKDIKYWEIWNEFNGSFSVSKDKPKDYADLVVAAYEEAKKADPESKIVMSCANFDVGFFDQAIKKGAADHFDIIAVHPYENLGAAMDGGEYGFLSMTSSLRKMLSDNKQPADIPLWINEMGYSAPVSPEAKGDARQAEAIVKAYTLTMAQGFQRLFWFEARGPSYGHNTDLGIIRKDWTLRPSYDAFKTMTTLLGPEPKYLGWLKPGTDAFGFVFQGVSDKVLIAWSPATGENKLKFDAAVKVVDLAGKETPLAAGEELTLTRVPVMVVGLPAKLTQLAQSQLQTPFPWGIDYSKVDMVSCRLGATNDEKGIKQTSLKTTAVVNELTESWRRTDFSVGGEGRYVYFRVEPTFAPFGTKNLEITVVARRIAADKSANLKICYESIKGYHDAKDGTWQIPADEEWHENTWTVDDANFVGGWGWNFRTESTGSRNEVYIKEVRVKRTAK